MAEHVFPHLGTAQAFLTNLGEVILAMIFFWLCIMVMGAVATLVKLYKTKSFVIELIQRKLMYSSLLRPQLQMYLPTAILTLDVLYQMVYSPTNQ